MAHGGGGQGVLLIVMPWLVPRPVLGVSLLKRAVVDAGIPCDVRYFNMRWFALCMQQAFGSRWRAHLDHGETVRRLFWLSESLFGEWVFAEPFFGAGRIHSPKVERFLRERFCPGRLEPAARLLSGTRALVPAFLRECAREVDATRYFLAGFSSSYAQQMPSLGLARLLKNRHPRLHISFGGANCHGVAEPLLERFSFVDSVFTGEADRVFPEFARRLRTGGEADGLGGVAWRRRDGTIVPGAAGDVPEVESLPEPDFDDFFTDLRAQKMPPSFHVALPYELSRGCWWRKCVFCEYAGGEANYRTKSPRKCLDDIRSMTRRHGVRLVHVVDNILAPAHFESVLPALSRLRPHVRIESCQVKSNLTRRQADSLRTAGAISVQPGIESLSTSLLRRMRKGVTALENVACLKRLREAGLRIVIWNVLYGFPGETAGEYRHILDVLRRITHLSPPTLIQPVRLYRNSPAFLEAAGMNFRRVRPHWMYRHIFPYDESVRRALAMRFEYDLPARRDPEACVRPVREFVSLWWERAGRGNLLLEPLGGGRALIRDTRFNRVEPAFRLSRFENVLYQFCADVRSRGQIMDFAAMRFPGKTGQPSRVAEVLRNFWEKQLMVVEGDLFLSVAIRRTRRGRSIS